MFRIKNETEVKTETHEKSMYIDFEKAEDIIVYITAEKSDGLALDGGSTIEFRSDKIKIFNFLNSGSTIGVYWRACNGTSQRVSTYIPASENSDIEIEIIETAICKVWEVWVTVIV